MDGNQESLEVVVMDMDVDRKEGGHETPPASSTLSIH
jgi:hypothetical protein